MFLWFWICLKNLREWACRVFGIWLCMFRKLGDNERIGIDSKTHKRNKFLNTKTCKTIWNNFKPNRINFYGCVVCIYTYLSAYKTFKCTLWQKQHWFVVFITFCCLQFIISLNVSILNSNSSSYRLYQVVIYIVIKYNRALFVFSVM